MSRNLLAPSVSATVVTGMAAGDDRSLGALYDAYGQVAYGLAFTITGTAAAAESVVAAAFAEAWRTAGSFQAGRTSVLAWLTAIVRRCALRATGGVKVARRIEAEVEMRAAATPCPMRDALRALTTPQQNVIELSYYRGFTVAEIATELGEPESGARELLRSAMQELRTTLSGGTSFEEHVVTRA